MTQPRAQQQAAAPGDRTWELQLTLDESSVLLEALIELPFKQVFELIGKLNHQAQQFYAPGAVAGARQAFHVDSREFSCCVKALGALPYSRVSELLANLHRQLSVQQAAFTGGSGDDGSDDECR